MKNPLENVDKEILKKQLDLNNVEVKELIETGSTGRILTEEEKKILISKQIKEVPWKD